MGKEALLSRDSRRTFEELRAARVWGRYDDFRLELPYKNIESRLEMLLLW